MLKFTFDIKQKLNTIAKYYLVSGIYMNLGLPP